MKHKIKKAFAYAGLFLSWKVVSWFFVITGNELAEKLELSCFYEFMGTLSLLVTWGLWTVICVNVALGINNWREGN